MDLFTEMVQLVHEVPRPPGETIPAGVSADALKQFVFRTGLRLPLALERWLSYTNGPCIGPGGFYGINPARGYLDIEFHLRLFPEWSSRQWIPIAGDGCGNQFIIPIQSDFGSGFPVLFIDVGHDSASPAYVVSSDLEHFIVATLRKELFKSRWPFDKVETVEFDPAISALSETLLPWSDSTA